MTILKNRIVQALGFMIMVALIFFGTILLTPKLGWLFLILYGLFGYGVYLWFQKTRTLPVKKPFEFSFKQVGMTAGLILIMMLGSMMLNVLKFLITGVPKTSENQQAILNVLGSHNQLLIIYLLIYGSFLAPIVEELVFRGIILNWLTIKWRWLAVLVSGLVFGLLHVGVMITSVGMAMDLLTYTAMGVFLASIYQITGSLQQSMAVHLGNNLIILVAQLFLLSH